MSDTKIEYKLSRADFAEACGVSPLRVEWAVRRGKLPKGSIIDVGSRLALEFAVTCPFRTDADGQFIIPGDFLDPAMQADDESASFTKRKVDIEHPVFRLFLARSMGRVMSEAEGAAFADVVTREDASVA